MSDPWIPTVAAHPTLVWNSVGTDFSSSAIQSHVKISGTWTVSQPYNKDATGWHPLNINRLDA